MTHAVPLVAVAQTAARRVEHTTTGPAMWQVALVVEWASILMTSRQHGDEQGVAMAYRALVDLLATPSIPGVQIVDPETGRAFVVHEHWPKCRFNSDPVAKAAHNQRITDPKVLAAIEKQEVRPETCNCEWCLVAQWDFGGPEYAAWLRAHQEARETWPAAYWERLYPMLVHVGVVKTEAEAFAA